MSDFVYLAVPLRLLSPTATPSNILCPPHSCAPGSRLRGRFPCRRPGDAPVSGACRPCISPFVKRKMPHGHFLTDPCRSPRTVSTCAQPPAPRLAENGSSQISVDRKYRVRREGPGYTPILGCIASTVGKADGITHSQTRYPDTRCRYVKTENAFENHLTQKASDFICKISQRH